MALRDGAPQGETTMVIRAPRPSVAAAVLLVLALLLAVATVRAAEAQAPAKVVVGVLPFTSSGPVFLAADRGYFRDQGLDVELAFFQAAPPIAVATAANEVTFGVTALTAAAYNLAAEGRLAVVAGQAREKKGYTGNLILVTKAAYDRGLDRLDELFDQPFGLTQMGSPSHYQVGQLADAQGIATAELDVRAFQTLPNLVAALKSGAVTWAIIAPPIATGLVDSGAVVSLGPYSDHGSFQFGAVLASDETLRDRPETVRAFLRAYAKGLADYAEIVQHPESERRARSRGGRRARRLSRPRARGGGRNGARLGVLRRSLGTGGRRGRAEAGRMVPRERNAELPSGPGRLPPARPSSLDPPPAAAAPKGPR